MTEQRQKETLKIPNVVRLDKAAVIIKAMRDNLGTAVVSPDVHPLEHSEAIANIEAAHACIILIGQLVYFKGEKWLIELMKENCKNPAPAGHGLDLRAAKDSLN